MLMLSLKGYESEKLFTQDKNMFLVDFLEADEDQDSMLSIRSTVIEFLDEANAQL